MEPHETFPSFTNGFAKYLPYKNHFQLLREERQQKLTTHNSNKQELVRSEGKKDPLELLREFEVYSVAIKSGIRPKSGS